MPADSIPIDRSNLFIMINFVLIILNIALTIFITYRQMRINADNLKLNLYDKRYMIYEATIEFIYAFLQNMLCKEEMSHLTYEFRIKVKQATFLFDDHIEEYLLELYEKAESIRTKRIRQKDYLDDLEWFEAQKEEVKNHFKLYMKFKK